jgi:ABC-2 type transport system ATP-binding protein
MSKTPLYVSELTKDYQNIRAVDRVSFEIYPGEVFGLLGPNGAGKTSTIAMITTLEKPTSGHIEVFGYNVKKNPIPAKLQMGVVPQELVSHAFFTVHEIMRFHSSYFGLWHHEEKIAKLLKLMDLWSTRDRLVATLSGGMKRRLLIAKALVNDPKLVLLDEPTAGVDIELRAQMWEFIKELKNQGVSILLTTHYLEEAEKLCDRVGVLHHGKLRKIDRTKALIEQMTPRAVLITLNEVIDCENQFLKEKRENTLLFHIPRKMSLGELLQQIQLPTGSIRDIEVREGTLEEAFQAVLGEAK